MLVYYCRTIHELKHTHTHTHAQFFLVFFCACFFYTFSSKFQDFSITISRFQNSWGLPELENLLFQVPGSFQFFKTYTDPEHDKQLSGDPFDRLFILLLPIKYYFILFTYLHLLILQKVDCDISFYFHSCLLRYSKQNLKQ